MARKMRLGLGQFSELSEERLKFIKQLGVEEFCSTPHNSPVRNGGSMRTSFDSGQR